MLHENTKSGKMEQLEQIRDDIDDFIATVGQHPTVDDNLGMNLLKLCNALCMRVNGSYGSQQELFDAENKRLASAYSAFWNRIDASTPK